MLLRFPVMAEAAGADGSGSGGGSGAPVAEPAVSGGTAATQDAGASSPASPPAKEPAALDWRAMIPQDYRENPTVNKYKTFGDFVKGAVETAEFVGRSIQLPRTFDPAKAPEDMATMAPIFKRLGLPETAEGYAPMKAEEQDFLGYSAENEAAFHREAHALGLLPWQVDRLKQFDRQRWQGIANQTEAAKAEAATKGRAELGRMHGANTPHVTAMANFVYELMGQGVWGGPEVGEYMVQKIEESGLVNDPKFISGLANLGERMREGAYHGAEFPSGVMTGTDLDQELKGLTEKEFTREGLTPAEKRRKHELYQHKANLAAR